jgi:hypothetical protein
MVNGSFGSSSSVQFERLGLLSWLPLFLTLVYLTQMWMNTYSGVRLAESLALALHAAQLSCSLAHNVCAPPSIRLPIAFDSIHLSCTRQSAGIVATTC